MIRCCICGDTISDSRYACNPWPLCSHEDTKSVCCQDCDELVTLARILTMRSSKEKEKIEIGDKVTIFWSKNSNMPIDVFFISNVPLSGIVHSINPNTHTASGSWGKFELDLKEDSYIL